MLEQLRYQNHLGEAFDFGKDGIFVNISELHDYSWSMTKKNNRIAALDYSVGTKKLPVVIICKTEAEGIAARNKLFEIAEKDVLALQHGKIYLDGYYLRCYVTKSAKKKYLYSKRYMEVTLTLTTDFPYWVKETTVHYLPNERGGGSGFLDFAFDYPYDFFSDTGNETLDNASFVGANFRLDIFGACTNPTVYIAGHAYTVNCDVAENEHLTIDSSRKTITVTANDGTVRNVFSKRDRNSYIFEKIKPGNNSVTWPNSFGFDVTIYEERSEPKWT